MAKAVKTVASVVGVVAGIALVATGVGAPLGLGLTAASLSTIATAAALVGGIAGMLSKPRGASGGTANRLQATLVPATPRVSVHGRTAMATDVRYEEYTGGADQPFLWRVFAVASHRVHSILELWLDEKLAWTSAGGVTAEFAGYLQVIPILEATAANVVNISPTWNASTRRRLTGCALLYVRFKRTGNSKKAESPFASSVTTRVTIIGEGRLYYDPRRDSTVPGGSGPMRATDQSTWAYVVDGDTIGRNGALGLLNQLLGWRINGKLAVGRGTPPARLDLPSWITAANLAAEAVAKVGGGSEPRYCTDGVVTEDEDGSAVIQRWEGSINGRLLDDGGRLSLRVWHNDLALPVHHFTADDILGGAQWNPTIGLDEDRNIGRGRYVDLSPASLGQLVDYPQVTLPSADGIDRVLSADFDLVQSVGQAQRLIKQRLQRMAYSGRFTAEFRATAWNVKRGDVVTLDFYPAGFNGRLFRVLERSVSVDGRSKMTLMTEHPAVYAWDREEAPAVQPAEPDRYDWRSNPLLAAIDDVENAPVPWGRVTDLDGTRPTDNADKTSDNTSKDTAAFGGRPTPSVLAQIDAAKAATDALFERTDPHAGLIAAAQTRADQAFDGVTDANRRINEITAGGDVGELTAKVRTLEAAEVRQNEAIAGIREIIEVGDNSNANLRGALTAQRVALLDADKVIVDSIVTLRGSYGGNLGDLNQRATVAASDAAVAVQQSTRLSAAFAGAGGDTNRNSTFAVYPDGAPGPGHWQTWNGGRVGPWRAPNGHGRPDIQSVEGSPYAVDMIADEGGQAGLYQDFPAGGGDWTVSGTAELLDGTWAPSGILIYLLDAQGSYLGQALVSFQGLPSTDEPAGSITPFRVRRWRQSVTLPKGGGIIRIYAMASWTGFGYGAPYTWMRFYRAGISPASTAETAAGQALTTANRAVADVIAEASVRASEDGSLARSINGTVGRIGDLETRTGIQAESIALHGQQLGSRLITSAVSPGGRAEITLYSSSNGGAGVDVVGDGRWRGKLLVGEGTPVLIDERGLQVFYDNGVPAVQLGLFG